MFRLTEAMVFRLTEATVPGVHRQVQLLSFSYTDTNQPLHSKSVTALFPVAVTKYPDKGSLKKKGSLPHSSRLQAIAVGKPKQEPEGA